MKDNILVGIKDNIRIHVARSTDLVDEARRRHNMYPIASAALGRTMTITAIMGTMLKNDETVVSVINGGGPLGTIMAEADANGDVRGYVGDPNIHVTSNHTGKLAVGYGVGKTGSLRVIKDLKLKDVFTGQVPMVNGEIAEEFTYYFASSEQTPSVVSAGVLVETDNSVSHAGGFIIQLLPGHTEEDIVFVEETIKDFPHISKLMSEGMNTEEIMKKLIPDVKVLEQKEIRWNCKCNTEKMTAAIIASGKDEIKSMIEEDGKCEITCTYCKESVVFDENKLNDILKAL